MKQYTPLNSITLIIFLMLFVSNTSASTGLNDHFVTTWQTDHPGVSDDSSISIPTFGSGYRYDVDWDNDGVFDEFDLSGDVTHDFGQPGTYTIRIRGAFPQIYFNDSGDSQKLLSVNQWGAIQWRSMAQAFAGASHMQLDPNIPDVPDLSMVTDLSGMFYGASTFNQDISDWDTSQVNTLLNTFAHATAFDQNLCGWDTAAVQIMASTFAYAKAYNQSMDCWDTSSVLTMANMFSNAHSFNQSIGSWNTSHVTTMERMFNGAHSFNQSIGHWNTSRVTNMANMFNKAFAFNQDIGGWDLSQVYTIKGMFKEAFSFNQAIGHWNTMAMNDMSDVFEEAISFNQPIGMWDMANVLTVANMFRGAISFNQDITTWDTSNVTSLDSLFRNAVSFNQDISLWNTERVTTMRNLFYNASAFNHPLGNWKLSEVQYMGGMFDHSGLSNANYGATLVQWSHQNQPTNVALTAAGIGHCHQLAETAKNHLSNQFLWSIQDAGHGCEPQFAQGQGQLLFNHPALTDVVATIQVIDEDLADVMNFAITGKDAAHFNIDQVGVLSFKQPADFTKPKDSDGNNVYELQVTVTDSRTPPKSDSADVFVTIYDINDTTSPGTPVAADLLDSADSGVFSDDNITTHKQLSFQLMCSEAGSTLEMWAGPLAIKPLFCEQAGLQVVRVDRDLTEGVHVITYAETDAAGNQSAPSMSLLVTIDRQAPTLNIHEQQSDFSLMVGQTDPFSLVEMATNSDSGCITSSQLSGEFSCQFSPVPGSGDAFHVYTNDLAGNSASVSGRLGPSK